jgi:acetyl-CoA carboxylase beta subunit
MKDGKWLEPRYNSKEIFEKDYSKIDLSGMYVKCPGCKESVSLNRKNNFQKSAGWCKKCNRAVTI